MDKEQKQTFDWLPIQMPGVAVLMKARRAKDGDAHFKECWKRGVVNREPGWFFASEGAISIGVPDPSWNWNNWPELQGVPAAKAAVLILKEPGNDLAKSLGWQASTSMKPRLKLRCNGTLKNLTMTERHGPHLGNCLLTDEQVDEIRARYLSKGSSIRRLAHELGLSRSVVGNIIKGKTYVKPCAGAR